MNAVNMILAFGAFHVMDGKLVYHLPFPLSILDSLSVEHAIHLLYYLPPAAYYKNFAPDALP